MSSLNLIILIIATIFKSLRIIFFASHLKSYEKSINVIKIPIINVVKCFTTFKDNFGIFPIVYEFKLNQIFFILYHTNDIIQLKLNFQAVVIYDKNVINS